MRTQPQSEAYVLGVRASQLARVLLMDSAPEPAHARAVQSFALRYCQALETDLLGAGREAAHLRRRAASIEETAASEREGTEGGERNVADAEALQTDIELSAAALPAATRDCFRLGVEIVDGTESRRRGGPPMVPGTRANIPHPGLPETGSPPMEGSHWNRACGAWLAPNGLPMPPSSVGAGEEEARTSLFEPAAPRWRWRDPQRLQDLLNAAGADLGQLLPMFAERRWSFDGIEAWDYWLWEYVEVGIFGLARQVPSCDLRTKKLIYGERAIRSLPKEGIQRRLIDAFHDEGWPSAVEFTEVTSRQRKNAIYALNKSLNPELMHFAECGDDVQWFPGPRPSRDAAQSS